MINIKVHFQNILKLIFGIGLLSWLLLQTDLKGIFLLMRQGNPVFLFTGIGLLLFSFSFLQAARLHWCIRSMTGSWLRSTRLFFIGFLFNNLLPTNIGGDAVRLYYLQKYRNESWGMSAALLFIYRISGLLILLTGGVTYLLYNYSKVETALTEQLNLNLNFGLMTGLLATVIVLTGIVVVLNNKRRSKLKGMIQQGISAFGVVQKKEYAGILGLAAGFHLGRIAGFYFLILFMGGSIEMVHLIFVLSITAVISLIPVSFGALGLMEGAITGSLILFGVSPEAATGVALVNRLVLVIIAGTGAIVYFYPESNN